MQAGNEAPDKTQAAVRIAELGHQHRGLRTCRYGRGGGDPVQPPLYDQGGRDGSAAPCRNLTLPGHLKAREVGRTKLRGKEQEIGLYTIDTEEKHAAAC
jgi:hypothetical protein